MEGGAEERKHRRFDLALPAQVRTRADAPPEVQASTRDISAGGVYFTLPREIEPGSELEWELMVPPEFSQGQAVRIRCRGKVIRVERPDAQGKVGVAATIEEYEFIKA